MIKEEVFEIFSNVMGMPKEKITINLKAEDVEKWDSIQHLNLILTLEEKFSVKFEPEEIQEMLSLEKIINVLGSKLK